MQPLGNHLLVEKIDNPMASTTGIIYLPAIARDDYNTGGKKVYRVLAVGPGRRHNKTGRHIPIECEPGDRVICHSYTEGPEELDGRTLMIRESQILAVIPKSIENPAPQG